MTNRAGLLSRFLGGLWKVVTFCRNVVFNLLFLLIVVIILGSLLDRPIVTVPDGAALVIQPRGRLVDETTYINPLAGLLGGPGNNPATGETLLRDLLEAIELAAEDESISALVLSLGELRGGGFSKLRELGTAITAFRESGKPVYAVSDLYSQTQYYVAAHADEILLNPVGGVELTGFGSYQMYYKSALDSLRVNMHIFRVGTYKSAVEPFERDDMSPEAREANALWLGDLWSVYKDDVNRLRGLDEGFLDTFINNMDTELENTGGDTARLALESGLVDALLDRNGMREKLRNEIGTATDNDSFRQIGHENYLMARTTLSPDLETADRVGVIVASGAILDGEHRPGTIGGDSLSRQIRRANDDDSVKALVLRIDSPGGSAFASEIIRSELLNLKASGKPLVVSMGSVAASGGYWIASPADQIWASPVTITGSIGIYGLLPTFEDSLEAIGISADGVGTTDLAGAFAIGRPLPETAGRVLQLTVENGYQRFLEIVSTGRNMTTAEVDAVGQGRVWSGRRALELGLVDEMGDLDQAVEAAAELANLDDWSVRYIEQPISPAEQFLRQLSDSFTLSSWKNPLLQTSTFGSFMHSWEMFSEDMRLLLRFNDPADLYLHCLECKL